MLLDKDRRGIPYHSGWTEEPRWHEVLRGRMPPDFRSTVKVRKSMDSVDSVRPNTNPSAALTYHNAAICPNIVFGACDGSCRKGSVTRAYILCAGR